MTDAPAAAALRPQPPRTIRIAVIAIAVQVALNLLSVLSLWIFTAALTTDRISNNNLLLKDHNKKAVPKAEFVAGSKALLKDVHDYRVTSTLWSVVYAIIFAYLAYSMLRGRGIARWVYIVLAVLFFFPGFTALTVTHQTVWSVLAFVVALVAAGGVILLILPESARYFAAVKALRMPPGAATAGAARPAGLRALFAPPPPRGGRPTPGKGNGAPPRKPATTRQGSTRSGRAQPPPKPAPPTGRGKPKVRAEATAVTAPGAADEASTIRSRGKSRKV